MHFDARLPGGQGSTLASGIYFCTLTAGLYKQTPQMNVIKQPAKGSIDL